MNNSAAPQPREIRVFLSGTWLFMQMMLIVVMALHTGNSVAQGTFSPASAPEPLVLVQAPSESGANSGAETQPNVLRRLDISPPVQPVVATAPATAPIPSPTQSELPANKSDTQGGQMQWSATNPIASNLFALLCIVVGGVAAFWAFGSMTAALARPIMGAKKAKSSTAEEDLFEKISTVIGIVAIVVIGILVIPYYLLLKAKYASGVEARRINDYDQFSMLSSMAIVPIGGGCFILGYAAMLVLDPGSYEISPAVAYLGASYLFCVWAYLMYINAAWLAAVHLGVVVNCKEDTLTFRFDQESYDLIDYFKMRNIFDLPRIDIIQISAIRRITRQRGIHVYLIGDFGSRRITFSNKQKRDECIFAITSCTKATAKVFSEFEIS